jgi:hypothetical protein
MNPIAKPLLALLAVLVCGPVRAASVPSSAVPAKSCGDPGKELETNFELLVPKGSPIKLVYAGCAEEGRNDYLSGYTERYYKGADGYGVTLVTNHGDGAYPAANEEKSSEVLVSRGREWVSRMGTLANTELVSGAAVSKDGYAVRAVKEPPTVPECEAKLNKQVYYRGSELWLLTKTKAYYYREDCDICAELDSCDLQTHAVKEEIVAHSVSCSDIEKYKKGADVVYDYCAK